MKFEDLLKNPPHRIVRLEDTDGDGRFDKSIVFADKLVFPQGVLWHEGAVYTCSPPSLWKLEDTDGDGVCDKRTELVTKFGSTGNAADIHGPVLGPDGRFYWADGRHGHDIAQSDGVRTQGKAARIFRCKPDGTEVEVVCGGGMDNPVEIAFTEEGEPLATVALFEARPARVDAIIHCIEGGVFPWHEVHKEFKKTGDLLPPVAAFGQVAPAGLMRYRSGAFGAGYLNNFFSAQFNTHKVLRHIVERDGASFKARSEDFVVFADPDSHLTDVLEDADGSLLVINTGGWFRQGCPFSQISKPDIKGAIYRVRAARRSESIPHDRQLGTLRAWAEVRKGFHPEQLSRPDATLRQIAVYGAGLHRAQDALRSLCESVKTDTPPIRREAATALGRIGKKEAVPALLESMKTAGGDRFLEHAIIYALIRLGDAPALEKALEDAHPAVRRAALVALDQMDGPNITPNHVIPQLDPSDAALRQASLNILISRPGWASQAISLLQGMLDREDLPEAGREECRRIILAFPAQGGVQDLLARTLREGRAKPAVRLLIAESMAEAPLDRLPAIWAAELRWLLDDSDPRIVRQSVAALRKFDVADFDDALLGIVRDSERPHELRIEALGAAVGRLARLEGGHFELLLSTLSADFAPLLRISAADALARSPLSDSQLGSLTSRAIPQVGALELPRLVGAFERSGNADVGKKLIAALQKAPALESVRADSLRRALSKYPVEVKRSADPILKKIEGDIEAQKARLAELEPLLKEGDTARGREVFTGRKAACSACHAVAGQGGRVGPDLTKIGGVRAGRDLLEAVVFPSASFARGFEPVIVRTKDGAIVDGIVVRETAEAVTLYTAERVEKRVPRSSIDALKESRVSVMPQGLDAQLTKQELADLLAYLQGLK
jgi:putative membrane-bound dehydrogenase-like protein